MGPVQDAYSHVDHPLYDVDHHKIGKIKQAFRGPTGSLDWVTVSTGRLHHEQKFVPIADADRTDEGLVVPFSKDTVAAAPTIDPHGEPDDVTLQGTGNSAPRKTV